MAARCPLSSWPEAKDMGEAEVHCLPLRLP